MSQSLTELLDPVIVYAVGLVCASVCVADSTSIDEMLDFVNRRWPTGIQSGWGICTDEAFADGTPNPCPCERFMGRTHRLLSC